MITARAARPRSESSSPTRAIVPGSEPDVRGSCVPGGRSRRISSDRSMLIHLARDSTPSVPGRQTTRSETISKGPTDVGGDQRSAIDFDDQAAFRAVFEIVGSGLTVRFFPAIRGFLFGGPTDGYRQIGAS